MKAMKLMGASLLAAMMASYAVVSAVAQTGGPKHSDKQGPVYVQDGGVSQSLESIFIPPMVNAPFTCVLHTEWVRSMPDGGTLTLVNQRTIARESSGRFYQERCDSRSKERSGSIPDVTYSNCRSYQSHARHAPDGHECGHPDNVWRNNLKDL